MSPVPECLVWCCEGQNSTAARRGMATPSYIQLSKAPRLFVPFWLVLIDWLAIKHQDFGLPYKWLLDQHDVVCKNASSLLEREQQLARCFYFLPFWYSHHIHSGEYNASLSASLILWWICKSTPSYKRLFFPFQRIYLKLHCAEMHGLFTLFSEFVAFIHNQLGAVWSLLSY